MAIIYTAAFVHSLVAVFDSAKDRVLAESVSTACWAWTATFAAFSPFTDHSGMALPGRTSPYPSEPDRSTVPATNGNLPAEPGLTWSAYTRLR